MEKKIKISIIVIMVLLIVALITGTTYALFTNSGNNNSSINVTVKGLEAIVEYKNNGLFEGDLNFGNSYEDGIKTNIVFYNKDKDVPLRGYIYLDLLSLPDGFENEEAFKWTIKRKSKKCSEVKMESYEENGKTISCLATGNFLNTKSGTSITMMGPFDLGKEKEDFDIYVWVDSEVKIKNTELESQKLQLSARAYAYQSQMDD